MKRFILTGTPGCGKTSIIRALEISGICTVAEAATDVIAYQQMQGQSEPWTHRGFVDAIVKLQVHRQKAMASDYASLQCYDRSPICSYALAIYLGVEPSSVVLDEIARIEKERIYQKRVFFVEHLGFITPTDARRISFEEALVFEQIHRDVYQQWGYVCQSIPAMSVDERVAMIAADIKDDA